MQDGGGSAGDGRAGAVGFGRGRLRLFRALPDPLPGRHCWVTKLLPECARDEKGATNGSCAKHRSEAEPWTARPPKRPTGVQGDVPKIMQLVMKK